MLKKIALFLIVLTLIIYRFASGSIVIQTNPFASADTFGLSPFWTWETLETQNFKITFPTELRSVAIRSSQLFEEAHELLSPLLEWKPYYRPQVIIVDNNDSANGITAPIARMGIVLFVTPPESWSSLNFYDDWLRLLIIHEYTHFLNMDTTKGLYKPLRYVFGDTLLPNSIWPPWMLEGLAVYMETKYTGGGRGRSPYYEMFLRTAVDEAIFGSHDFITLNQLGGTNPYFPYGDTRYIFGYQLINQVGSEYGSKSLGELSSYSSKNIPFFLNSHLQEITGKTWYEFWDQWIVKTRMRVEDEIKRIKTQPLSQYQLMTSNSRKLSNSILGVAVSADQKWIAYNMNSSEQRSGIYLQNLKTGKTERLNDKNLGVGMKFSPDSQFLFCSELRQLDPYYTYSDLEYYSLKDRSRHWLTHQLRAKDPDVAPDGKWIVFTLAEMGTHTIALAPLIYDKVQDKFQLGSIEKIFDPPPFGRASNPKFSLNQKKIYFSFHPNGKAQEDIMEYDLISKRVSLVYSDGFFNRFPVESGKGKLYFVSNATGVDNLFEFQFSEKRADLVSNFITGVSLPTFDLNPNSSFYYASLFSTQGWNLAQIELLNPPIKAKEVKIPDWPAPSAGSKETNSNDQPLAPSKLKISNYSVFPSILPRAWIPLLSIDQTGVSVGAELLGFDAINQHRYFLGTAFQTSTQLFDTFALYSNRTLGVDWSTQLGIQTLSYDYRNNALSYTRSYHFNSSFSYPFPQIYSDFIPSLGFSFQKVERQNTLGYPKAESLPSIDLNLSYSNTVFSNLAIAPEGGRYSQFSSKVYLKGRSSSWKILWKDKEYFKIIGHSVLLTSIQGAWSSAYNFIFPSAAAILQGRNSQQVLNSVTGSSTFIRGYPGFIRYSQFNLVGGLDYIFPIARVFKGWGTNPVFIDNLAGFIFLESSYASTTQLSPSGSSAGVFLPSGGGGLRLYTELFYFPVTLSYEYHKGFRETFGKTDDLFFQLSVQGFQF